MDDEVQTRRKSFSPFVLQKTEGAASLAGPRALAKHWMKERRLVIVIAEGADPTDPRSEFGL